MPYFYNIKYRLSDGTVNESDGYIEDLEDKIHEIESDGGKVLDVEYES